MDKNDKPLEAQGYGKGNERQALEVDGSPPASSPKEGAQQEEDRLDALLSDYAEQLDGEQEDVPLSALYRYAHGELEGARAAEIAERVARSERLQDLVARYRRPDPAIYAAARRGFLRGMRRAQGTSPTAVGADPALSSRRGAGMAPEIPPPDVARRRARSWLSVPGVAATLVAVAMVSFLVVPRVRHGATVEFVDHDWVRQDQTRGISASPRDSRESVEYLRVGQVLHMQLTPPGGARYAVLCLVTAGGVDIVKVMQIQRGVYPLGDLEVGDTTVGMAFLLLVYLDQPVEADIIEQIVKQANESSSALVYLSREDRNERIRAALSRLGNHRIWMDTSSLFEVVGPSEGGHGQE